MTLQEIERAAYRRLGFGTTSPDSTVQTRIREFVNRWHRRILSSPGMESMRRVGITFSSVAGQATYGVGLRTIQYITEQTTTRKLGEMTLDRYRSLYPDPARFSGTPDCYVPMGVARVHTRPASALALFVKSTSGSDIGTAYVEVTRTNGYRGSVSVPMTGVTAVALSATVTDVVDVVDFYLSAAAVGLVTLHTVSGAGVEISRIQPGQTAPRFLRFALAPTPAGVIAYTVDGVTDVHDMAVATDEPLILLDFHDILTDGAVYDEWVSKGREKEARELRGDIEFRIRQLRAAAYEHTSGTTGRPRSDDTGIRLPIS